MPKLVVLMVNQEPFSPDVHITATLRNLNIQSESVELIVNPEYQDRTTLMTTVTMAARKHGLEADLSKCICTPYTSSDGVQGIAVQVNGGKKPSAACLLGRTPNEAETKGEEKAKGGCFIATAAFGTPEAPAVVILKEFREQILRPRLLGHIAIRLYETLSPPVASIIAENRTFRFLVRKLLVLPLSRWTRGFLR